MSKHISEEDNFRFLAVALVLLLLVTAIVDEFASRAGQRLVPAATVVTLAIAVWSVRNTEVWFRTGIGMVVLILLVTVSGQLLDKAGLHYAHLTLMLVFFGVTGLLALRQVFTTGEVTSNKILGAICIYLLIGLMFAVLYLLLAQFIPSTFNGIQPLPWYDNFADFIYFSFVSLTTLGFGDVTPALPVARFLVYFEAILGQFYLTVLVASLVGMRISNDMSKK